MRTPWDGEPVPDRTTPVRHMQTIPDGWTGCWPRTAHRCLAETGGADAPLGADSGGAEITRYEDVEIPDKDARDFIGKHRKVSTGSTIARPSWDCRSYWPRCPHRAAPAMPTSGAHAGWDAERRGFGLAGRLSHADRWCDAEYNYWMIFWTGMIPHTKQRQGATNRATPNRKKAARLFDRGGYRMMVLIEGVFGAEESRGRQLHCRARPDGQPPAVRQGEGHRMERAGARPVRVGQQAESTNPVIRRTTDARSVRLMPPVCLW